MSDDPYGLERFVEAQAGVYPSVVEELGRGRKTSHWMWFIFPQLAGLGFSAMSRTYGLSGIDEARAYLAHPVLGPRLWECVALVLSAPTRDAREIFGEIDSTKLRSSMTLFHRAAPEQPLFAAVLDRFFGGVEDALTVARLRT